MPPRAPRLMIPLILAGGILAWHLWGGGLTGDSPGRSYTLQGRTMGTTYLLKARGSDGISAASLQIAVNLRLREINAGMSTYQPDSEISRFNRLPVGQVMTMGKDFQRVLLAALELSRATGGAFDPTIGPLVNLWGFGPNAPATSKQGGKQGANAMPPARDAIMQAKAKVGHGYLTPRENRLEKTMAGVYVDLSAIAKGFAVDELVWLLERRGFTDYLVEIGGEVRVRGENDRGEKWAVGMERPDENAPVGDERLEAVHGILRLNGGALATSGSYRRFRKYKVGGQPGKSHHIIDPRTGYPTNTGLVSVTVLAGDCITADGAATALMVMGVREGLRWVAVREDMQAVFVRQEADGRFTYHPSPGFPQINP